MPGRKYEPANGYRYGFNGKEKDKDMNSLTAYDYGFRIYNPAIGRFFSVDPLTRQFAMLTPYQFASNRPILNIDLDGLEGVQYTEVQNINGVNVTKRVVEVDVRVAISRQRDTYHYYSRKPENDAGVAADVLRDLRKEFPDDKFTDDQGNNVIWRFNVTTFEVDASQSINTEHERLKADNTFRVIGPNGNAQYRGFILQKQHITNEVLPDEPGDIPVMEDGHVQRTFDVTVNNEYYSESNQRTHTIGHEVTHFFLRLHPDKAINNPENTPEGHRTAGGGILNYGTMHVDWPGQLRTAGAQPIITFRGLSNLTQQNVNDILRSVPGRPDPPPPAAQQQAVQQPGAQRQNPE